uniref:CARD domain-containing protein n=1 Tax=Branchiostoma floridae TaxID=7739 RepID=C3YZT2_BRAFL|eukprot:XP_002598341.1 hypothetical protein BRAFLDRAFT_69697 [Branchiostoma floridae]
MKGAVVFTLRPPEKGKFLFEPYVGLGGSKDSFRICEYIVVCDQAKDITDNAPLPDYKGSWGPGKEVVSKGLTPVTHPSPYVQCEDGKAEVEFKMEQDVKLTAKLFEETLNESHLQRFVAHEVIDDVVKFHVVAPKDGNHGLAIYAREDGEDTFLCNYITQSSSDQTQSGVPFPTVTDGLYGPVVPAFSELGLCSKSSRSAFIECDTGELDLRLGADRVLFYDHDLFWETLEEKVNLHGNVFKQILDGEVQFWLRLPKLGKYRLAIYAKEPGQQGDMTNVINYCINCTGTREGLGPFPVVNGKQWGRKLPTLTDLALTPVSHPTAYIQASGTLEIEFDSTERLDYTNHLKLWKMGQQQRDVGDFACHKILNDGKTMVLVAKFPEAGEYSLELYVRDADGKDQNVMNYLINCEQSADPCQPFPEVMGRRWGPIYPYYNQLSITLVSHTDPVIITDAGDVTIAFGTAAPLWFYPELTHHDDGKVTDLTANAIIQDDPENGQQIQAKLILANAGYYKFSLFAQVPGANGSHQRAISYLIHGTDADAAGDSGTEHTGFPQFMGCWGTGCRIMEPNTRTLPGGDSQRFKLRVPGAAGVAVILPNKKWCHLQQEEEDGTWEGDVVVPPGDYTGSEIKVVAKMKDGGDSYLPLLQYIVESVPFPERPGGWQQGYQLQEPLVRDLKAKETVTFRGRFPGAAEVAVMLPTSQWIQLKKGEDGTWEGAVTMPGNKYSGDAVTLNVLPDDEEGDYTEILRYTLQAGADGGDDDSQNLGNDVEEEEDMGQEEEYQTIIRENRKTFEDNMDPVKVIPKFEEEKFIDEEEAQEMTLQVPTNANEVNKALLNVVSREGEEAFVVLRDVLRETKQTVLHDIIKDVKIDVNQDNTPEVIKKKLAEATKARNRSRIEKAIADYKEHGLSQTEDVYKEATRTLRLLTAREDLKAAINSRQKDQLKEAMQGCSEFKDELKKELNEAKRVLDAVLHLETLRHKIMAMNQATVAELKTYNQPPPAVNQVMMATFLLLGNSKAQIKSMGMIEEVEQLTKPKESAIQQLTKTR